MQLHHDLCEREKIYTDCERAKISRCARSICPLFDNFVLEQYPPCFHPPTILAPLPSTAPAPLSYRLLSLLDTGTGRPSSRVTAHVRLAFISFLCLLLTTLDILKGRDLDYSMIASMAPACVIKDFAQSSDIVLLDSEDAS